MKFGDFLFSSIDSDEYLNQIYENLLFNYAATVVSPHQQEKRNVNVDDALRFADLLSKSNHQAKSEFHKMWAQEIIALLLSTEGNNPHVQYVAGSVLDSIGNFQGLKLLDSTFSEKGILGNAYSSIRRQALTIPADKSSQFMIAQKQIYSHFKDRYYSYSAPTSMGKSFIMRMFIKEQIQNHMKCNFAFVVPTRALINEVRGKITEDLAELLVEQDYRIVTAVGDILLEEKHNFIFVMTPERLLYVLNDHPDFSVDYVFIDESHKLSSRDSRGPYYYKIVDKLWRLEKRPQMFFASPNIPNPEVYNGLIPCKPASPSDSQSVKTDFSPVTQIKCLVDPSSKQISIFNNHTKRFAKISCPKLEGMDLKGFLSMIEKGPDNNEKPFIAYFPSTSKTVEAAREFSATRLHKDNDKLTRLAEDIRSDIHKEYYLADLISKGIAYHIGYLPSSIRQRIEDLYKAGDITALFCTSTLVEGVNLPADNLVITSYKNGTRKMDEIEFRNLIGRVGRLDYNLFGSVYLFAEKSKMTTKFGELLEKGVPEQSLSVDKFLSNAEKKHIVDTLLKGTIELQKLEKQTRNSYDLMRKFAVSLLGDIMQHRDSRTRQAFTSFLSAEDENRIRESFSLKRIKQDDDIAISVDQTETLYQAIEQGGLRFPAIDNQGKYNKDELNSFLERLSSIFNWKLYEPDTLGRGNSLHWYRVILGQWVSGMGLAQIMNSAIKYKQENPQGAIYIDRTCSDYNDSPEHKNEAISEVLKVIDEVILFKLSSYFLKFSRTYKEIFNTTKVPNDWYEFVEYGSTNSTAIMLQKCGFSRESALYIIKNDYIKQTNPTLVLRKELKDSRSVGVQNEINVLRYNMPDIFEDGFFENDTIDK